MQSISSDQPFKAIKPLFNNQSIEDSSKVALATCSKNIPITYEPSDTPPLHRRTVKMRAHINIYCHAFSTALQRCPKHKCIPFLIKEKMSSRAEGIKQRLMSQSEFNEFDKKIATNDEMLSIRNYIENNSTVQINGKTFKVEEVSEYAPLLYQYFSKDKSSKIPNDYVEIFRNNCRIEPERETVILVDDFYTNDYDRNILEKLAADFDNVRLFNMSQWSDIKIGEAQITRKTSSHNDFKPNYSVEIPSHKESQYTSSFSSFLDYARLIALTKYDDIFSQSRDAGIKGCIYMDFDFLLKDKLGKISCPGGVSPYILDEIDTNWGNVGLQDMTIENSMTALSQPAHPTIMKAIELCSGMPYASFRHAIKVYFSVDPSIERKLEKFGNIIEIDKCDPIETAFLGNSTKKKLAKSNKNKVKWDDLEFDVNSSWKQKIAFPISRCIIPDTSRVLNISTWRN